MRQANAYLAVDHGSADTPSPLPCAVRRGTPLRRPFVQRLHPARRARGARPPRLGPNRGPLRRGHDRPERCHRRNGGRYAAGELHPPRARRDARRDRRSGLRSAGTQGGRQIVADTPPNTYDSITTVRTATPVVAVTTTVLTPQGRAAAPHTSHRRAYLPAFDGTPTYSIASRHRWSKKG